MAMKVALIVVVGLLASYPVTACSQSTNPAKEQLSFGVEQDQIEHPIPLPEGVKRLLSADPYVVDSRSNESLTHGQLPSSWFTAAYVHLADSNENDVVVIGRCPICGANFAPFWIFRPKGNDFEKIFFARALGMEIRLSRTNGYRDIDSALVVAQTPQDTVWRFDGEKYVAKAKAD